MANAAMIIGIFRDGMGGDAVLHVAAVGDDLRPRRAASRHPAVQRRERDRLRHHGARAESHVAVCRPSAFRHGNGQHDRGQRVHRRRDAARKARESVRRAGQRVRTGIHHRPGHRRTRRQYRPAFGILGGRGVQPASTRSTASSCCPSRSRRTGGRRDWSGGAQIRSDRSNSYARTTSCGASRG